MVDHQFPGHRKAQNNIEYSLFRKLDSLLLVLLLLWLELAAKLNSDFDSWLLLSLESGRTLFAPASPLVSTADDGLFVLTVVVLAVVGIMSAQRPHTMQCTQVWRGRNFDGPAVTVTRVNNSNNNGTQ